MIGQVIEITEEKRKYKIFFKTSTSRQSLLFKLAENEMPNTGKFSTVKKILQVQ